MIFTQYTEIIRQFKGNLNNFPTDEQTFKMQYALINQKIKTVDLFKKCLNQHLKSSSWFPTHIDLLVQLLKPLPKIEALKVLSEDDVFHSKIRDILDSRYALAVPHKSDAIYLRRTDDMTNDWIKCIQYAINKMNLDYKSLKLSEEEIYSLDVKEFLSSNNSQNIDKNGEYLKKLINKLEEKNNEFLYNKDESKIDLLRNEIAFIEKEIKDSENNLI